MAPQFCCPGGPGGDLCATQSTCMGDTYLCTGQANCAAGQVCCVLQSAPGVADSAQCQPSCPPGGGTTATGGNRFQVCQTSAECPSGQQCTPPTNGLTIATICQ
jgi:hypothetical protein